MRNESQQRYDHFLSLVQKYNEGSRQGIIVMPRSKLDEAGANFNEIRHPLVRKYSWSIPNIEALQTIKSYSPIFELGAGSGYWAKLLQESGSDVIAVDNRIDTDTKLSPTSNWFPVQTGDENLIETYPQHTLFMSWPDPRTKMAGKALAKYKGKIVIYIGRDANKRSPCMGDEEFYDQLTQEFQLVKEVAIPNWPGNDDKLFVYERRPN